jgi:hypothetical protein
MTSPSISPGNGQPLIVQIFLDPQNDEVSGLAGNFSFPEKLFDVESIITDNSAVSLWVKEPAVSLEKNIDGKTNITFEGIFPGGFRGVESPYYNGRKPGVLFTILLTPKTSGEGLFVVDNLVLHRFDANATEIPVDNVVRSVRVPELQFKPEKKIKKQVVSTSLQAIVASDDLVQNNAWYLLVRDEKAKSSIVHISTVETDSSYPPLADDFIWRTALSNPVVLLYQNRNKYVHVKVEYANNTFAITTVPPVENSKQTANSSRILIVSISIFLVLLYLYATYRAQHKKL